MKESLRLIPSRSAHSVWICTAPRHEQGQHQVGGEDDEDAADVLHAEGAGLLTVLLRTAVPSPPLLLHHV